MSAIHLAAAITACARIHIFPFTSRPDCVYTEAEAIVVGSPLPDELVSSDELGKFELEHQVKSGLFLAPNIYILELQGKKGAIIKYNGSANDPISAECFLKVFDDPSIKMEMTTEGCYRIDNKSEPSKRK